KRGFLNVRTVRTVGVLLDERFPLRAPARREAKRVHPRRGNRPAIGHRPQIAAADEVVRSMIEVVVSKVVNRDTLRREAVPGAHVEWEECCDGRALMVTEVMLSHLPMVVREAVGKCRALRDQQQAAVLVTEASDQDDLGWLEEFLAIRHVGHTARAALR